MFINTPQNYKYVKMATKYLTVMNRFLLALALCLFSIALAKSQNLEEEIEFNYIKAKYLLDTERYEDAIKAFTKIVQENSKYKDALLLRAKSKYAMAAYTGTKKDVLEFANISGINEMALILLGKADYKLGNSDAAINSLRMVAAFNTDDAQITEFLGNLYEEDDQMQMACENWQKAAQMGSSKARKKAKKECGGYAVEAEKVSKIPNRSTLDEVSRPNRTPNTSVDEERVEMKENRSTSSNNEEGTLNKPSKDMVLKTNGDNAQSNEETEEENGTAGTETNTGEVHVIEDDKPTYGIVSYTKIKGFLV